ncbi:phosphoribosyltransferase, partial [Pseudomonas amygdali]|uniref:phosphoribosyltransferase n=1 Tax=Pseudomonas amygdali TaxID=47877 RepID=UPI002283CCAE
DASDLEGKEILTWETFGDAAEELAARIHHSGFDPEILIAVARGGMIPGGALTYSLGVKTHRRHQCRVLHRRPGNPPRPVL